MSNRTALITGAAKRIGAEIAKHLHAQGYNVIIHYNHSQAEAEALVSELNTLRENSATSLAADLNNHEAVVALATQALAWQGEIDLLVNNASSFYPKPFAETSMQDWDALMNSNVKAAYFLSQALLPSLEKQQGNIINIVDANLERLLNRYSAYQMAKAALATMTKALAIELAPKVRVNGVAPGAILWAAHDDENQQKEKLVNIPMQRLGKPEDIANAVSFLANADYVTGHILTVDGGRSL